MFSLFKNACVYSLRSPDVIDLEKLNEQLAAYAFTPCAAADMARTGWRPITEESDKYFHAAGGYVLLVVRHEKKIIPAEAINTKLMAKVDQLEQNQGRKLKKAEKDSLKEEILHTLIPRAFVRSSFTQIWIDLKTNRIVVDTASAKRAENALALLRKSIGSLPVMPVCCENPAEVVLTEWLKQQAAPSPFILEDITSAKIESILESGASATFRKEPVGSETLETSVADGRLVTSLEVSYEKSFRTKVALTHDFTIKKIVYSDIFIEANDDLACEEGENQALARKEADFILMCDELAALITSMLTAFGGEVATA